ncbi:MAG: DegT/DnrJ/EryC1/StrS family aminotransferase [Planctomycetota bacterium]
MATDEDTERRPAVEGGVPVRADFLPFSRPSLGDAEEQEVLATLRSGWITTGPRTARFEELLRGATGARSVLAVNSCTAALHLSLVGLGVGPGDEVITTAVTWPSTANVVVHCGATPVFVDIEPETFNLDLSQVEAKITSATRAIVPVHMAGLPVDLDRVHAIAARHGLEVVEDAAHALGASAGGQPIGSRSRFVCFSFYPIKNITTGEGGALAMNREADEERLRVLALHGITRDAWKRYTNEGSPHWDCVAPGFKYNMPDLCAALGIHQLARLQEFTERRRRLALRYRELLADIEEIILPASLEREGQAHHLFIIMVRPELLRIDRDGFVAALKAENIGTGIHFRGLFLHPYYRDRFGLRSADFPQATFTSDRIVSLPLYPAMSDADVVSVASAIRKLVCCYRL